MNMESKQKKIIMIQKLMKKIMNKNVPMPFLEMIMMYKNNPNMIMFSTKNTLKIQ